MSNISISMRNVKVMNIKYIIGVTEADKINFLLLLQNTIKEELGLRNH